MTALHGIPVVILNGFLGSGKTTLVKNLLLQSRKLGLSVSVIVNEMSSLDVDSDLIADTDIVSFGDHNLFAIVNDNISSRSGINTLQETLDTVHQFRRPDLLIIETSGSSHPLPLVEMFRSRKDFVLKGIITLADSVFLEQDYDCGRELIAQLEKNLSQGIRNTVNLLAEQIMFSSHLLLTKADKLEAGRAEMLAEALIQLNPGIAVSAVTRGNLSIRTMLELPGYNYYRVEQLIRELQPELSKDPGSRHPSNMTSLSIEDERPFHPQRLMDTCRQYMERGIYRSKGFFWLPGRDRLVLLWNQAGGGISLEIVGYWRSGILEDPENGLTEQEIAVLTKKVAEKGGRFGDRRCSLTIIGERTETARFTQALRKCLLTEEEISFYLAGGHFTDPWPKNIIEIHSDK